MCAVFAGLVSLGAVQADAPGIVASVAEIVPDLQAEYGVPGVAFGLIQGGELVHVQGFGTAEFGTDAPITADTGFNVGSVTKSVTAFAVMRAVEQGLFGLDDSVFDHVTRWKLPRSNSDAAGVTVARLLSHTAGIYGDGLNDWKPTDRLPSIERELSGMAGARPVKLRWEPGTRWAYANGGYALLQLLLIEKSGGSFEQYVQREVLEPLGMTRSSYLLPPELVARSATPHHPRDEPTYFVHRTVTSTGGLHTTLNDLSRFALALVDRGPEFPRGGGVLKPETVVHMLEPAPAAGGTYGMGLSITRLAPDVRVVGHGGGAWGWISDYLVDPDRGGGYVLLANSTNSGDLHSRVRELWLRWYAGSIEREQAHPVVTDELRRLLGIWDLTLVVGERRIELTLELREDELRGVTATATRTDGRVRPLRFFDLTGAGFQAGFAEIPASYFDARVVTPTRIEGDYWEVARYSFEMVRNTNWKEGKR